MGSSVPLTILVHEWVTGGGLAGSQCPESWAAEGRAMRRAIAADFAALRGTGSRVIVTLDARWPDDPGPWTIVRIAPGESPGRLLELARAADYTVLIAPETTGILAGLTRAFNREGVRSLGSSPESIELTGNKPRLGELLLSCGIATPACRTIVPCEGLPEDFHYPAVLKPVDGAGSVDTFYLADALSLPEAARAIPTGLLQPFQPGIPMSASFLIGEQGTARLIGIGRQRIVIEDGRFHYLGGVLPVPCPQAEPLLRQAVEAIPGLRGFVGVDFLWDPSRCQAVVLEINPRATTSYVGLCRLLPPGWLARAWMVCCGAPTSPFDPPTDLADVVHAQQPITFDASGNIQFGGEGVTVP
jgi:tyramine---L-glutamate ligase